MAREVGDETLISFGLDVLTLAVLAILTTAPVGALGIGLAGPRLLVQQVKGQYEQKDGQTDRLTGNIFLSQQMTQRVEPQSQAAMGLVQKKKAWHMRASYEASDWSRGDAT